MLSRKVTIFIMLISIVLVSACSVLNKSTPEAKIDFRLKQALADSTDTLIRFFGECDGPIEGELKEKIESLGVELQTVTGELFTAQASAEAIHKLAKFNEVTRLAGAKAMKPLKKGTIR
ncbi:hypothetical protein KAR48_02270 [bacterium]|nr:hypothetical protein [bacterium]